MSVGVSDLASLALPAAAWWLAELTTGTAATAVAILAVAGIGLGMLAGRVDWRRGATVVVGCFVLFSARSIAAALARLARDVPAADGGSMPPPPLVEAVPAPSVVPYDPYAGASVPR